MTSPSRWTDRVQHGTVFVPTTLLSHDQQEALADVARQLGDEARHWRDMHIGNGTLDAEGKLPHDKKQEISYLDGAPRTSSVTDMDKLTGKKLSAFLAQLTPGVPVINEENTAEHNARILTEAKERAAREGRPGPTYWVIDPIDGTDNYVDPARKEYSVLIGLIEDGQPRFGLTYYPEFDQLNMTLDGKAIGRCGNTQTEWQLTPFTRVGAKGHTEKLHITPNVVKAMRRHTLPEDRHLSERLDQANIRTHCMVGGIHTSSTLPVDYTDYPNDQLLLEGKAHLSSFTKGGFEWDFAGRHAILRAAGGELILKETGKPPVYGQDDILYLRPAWLGHTETFQQIGLTSPDKSPPAVATR